MEAKNGSSLSSLLLVLGLLACMVFSSQAYDFYVGGRDGWVVNPSENFNHWAGRNRFQVHDNLVFKYMKGEDSVLQVTENAYHSCNTSSPLRAMGSGLSWFTFDRSGPIFFISGIPENCKKGQKLIVVVLAVRHKNSTAVPCPPPSPPSPPTSASSPDQSPPPQGYPSAAPTSEPPSTPAPAASDAPGPSSPSTSGSSSLLMASSGLVLLLSLVAALLCLVDEVVYMHQCVFG